VPIVLTSESLNLLEPSGSVKACNGIALLYVSRFPKFIFVRPEIPLTCRDENRVKERNDCKRLQFDVYFMWLIMTRALLNVKGKATPYRPGQALGGTKSLRFPEFKQSAHEDGKFVSPTHRPPLPPENIPDSHFC
jgi:hypothetical protein